jgi:hypothetical protein
MYRVKRLAIADFIGIPIFARKPDALVSMVFWDDRQIYQDGRRGDCTGLGALKVLATVFLLSLILYAQNPVFLTILVAHMRCEQRSDRRFQEAVKRSIYIDTGLRI